jgi:hypothetical protein
MIDDEGEASDRELPTKGWSIFKKDLKASEVFDCSAGFIVG